MTHVGYETIDIGTNNFVSRNFLFQFPSPFYNAGVRAAYAFSPKTTVTGFVLNRYNGTNDTGNRDLAPGFQIVQNFSANSSIVLNGLTSRENLAYDGTQQPGVDLSGKKNSKQVSVIDFVYANQFSPSLKFVLEGLARFGKATTTETTGQVTTTKDTSYNVAGAAGYLIFPFKNGNTAALRGEYLSQSKIEAGILPYAPETNSNKKPNLTSLTASYELKAGIFPGMRTFFEYRYDIANTKIFAGDDVAKPKKNQSTLTIGQVFAF